MGTGEHKKNAPKRLTVGIITMSTTRTVAEDLSGEWMRKRAEKEGHKVIFHKVIPDHADTICHAISRSVLQDNPHALLLNGGTGITRDDVTIEAARSLFDKELTAFGTLFAQLSYEEIDSAAILSRATAGVVGQTAVFCMPGSLKAVKLACKALIFPELGHIAKHLAD